MIRHLIKKIESKRNSTNIAHKIAIFLKDAAWFTGQIIKRLISPLLLNKNHLSSPTRIDIIQTIIDKMHAKTYLEIGIEGGICFEKIRCDLKIGIDPCEPYKPIFNKNEKYFQVKSDDFFNNDKYKWVLAQGIDVVFIDGLHEYKQVMRDVNNCIKYLNNGGYIVIHDCNPLEEVHSIKSFSIAKAEKIARKRGLPWSGVWMGDVWKAILTLKKRKDLSVFVLDCDSGLGIIRKVRSLAVLKPGLGIDKNIDRLDYNFFKVNRKSILNLKQIDHLHISLKLSRQEFLSRDLQNDKLF